MSKRTLMITMNAEWRGGLRAAGKRATARSDQAVREGQLISKASANGYVAVFRRGARFFG